MIEVLLDRKAASIFVEDSDTRQLSIIIWMLAVKVKCSPFSNIRKIKATIDRDIVERNEKKN
jgi:hypothetical protein